MCGRTPMQRTPLYLAASPDRLAASYAAPSLLPMVLGEINARTAASVSA
jgi:hypothetical protein